MTYRFIWVLAALCVAPFATAQSETLVSSYQRVSGVSGNLSSVGSDTLANLMSLWSESFKRIYPNIHIQMQAIGSATAPPALIEGTAGLGPMSRLMTATELDAFRDKYGYLPTAVPVAVDAMAIFVHQDNPLKSLTMRQVDGIFSATQRCYGEAITHWQDVGLKGVLARQPIQLFGRNSASGTYGYFKQRALCGGDFRVTVNEQPGSGSVVQATATSLAAMGYSGIGYRSSGVRALPLVVSANQAAIEATAENALNGRYPLSRFLYIYVNKHPSKPLPPLALEFLRWVLSSKGQALVESDGHIPLPATAITKALQQLQ